jgi:hypothetical protein
MGSLRSPLFSDLLADIPELKKEISWRSFDEISSGV